MSATDKPRARSPHRARARSPHRTRSRSPRPTSRDRHRHHHHHRSSHHRSKRSISPARAPLPLNASQISMRNFNALAPVFASYLEIQKNLILSDLETREAKGRFKSFVSH